ncbi:MAG: FCSD flavin-binding domain-containing protein [Rhodospirillales bacterium]|nr:FCSD flavin-binding domain-containing protein [Rhodospirillales bacterium]
MTIKSTRRQFLKATAATGAAISAFSIVGCATGPNVVVIGGGFGGSTAARYVKKFGPNMNVTLIEPKTSYTTCPFSNAYLGGLVDFKYITHTYDGLVADGINVVHDTVSGVDANTKSVTLAGGQVLNYDRLIVSPGIDFKWDVPGYTEETSAKIPHAWKAGDQTKLLKSQLEAMKDGGVVIICPPKDPFRCPPGPYERASMIAHYLKTNKPKSKVLILDRKDKFSKQGLFVEGWGKVYGKMVEWVSSAQGGTVESIDAANMTVKAEFDAHKGAVINFIPNQVAGALAHSAGLTNDKGWCPVNLSTFESTIIAGVHVIGDASIAPGMPKSGNAANSQAKACAWAVVQMLNGATTVDAPMTSNTCWSLISPDYGIHVSAVWQGNDKEFVSISGGVSGSNLPDATRKMEAEFAPGWYKNIVKDTWNV